MSEGQVLSARIRPATAIDRGKLDSPDYFLDWAFDEVKRVAARMDTHNFVARTTIDMGRPRCSMPSAKSGPPISFMMPLIPNVRTISPANTRPVHTIARFGLERESAVGSIIDLISDSSTVMGGHERLPLAVISTEFRGQDPVVVVDDFDDVLVGSQSLSLEPRTFGIECQYAA